MSTDFYVRRAAILGAGVMGAQIAAHLVNAGVQAVLFELPAEGDDPNANARKAIDRLKKLQPSPLASSRLADLLVPANYDTDMEQLRDCDLVIEAIAERIDLKKSLFEKVAAYVPDQAILGSNTSGLSINALAEVLPESLRHRFCGIHFFNPPRYMPLVELTPGEKTEAQVLDRLETFLTSTLGKGVIRAKDTPNFIANRIGVFSMCATMYHADEMGIPFDVVDALTGPAIGRPKSATFRTADVVGLDTLRHVAEGSAERLQDDPWHGYLKLPEWMHKLIDNDALGQKSGAGVYKKQGKEILVLDADKGEYRPSKQEAAPEVQDILKMRSPAEQFQALRDSDHPQAQFLWAIQRDVFHYAAYLLGDIAHNARELDLAIRWGFGWKMGPFEIWQAAGWKRVAGWIEEDIKAGKALTDAALPGWVHEIEAVHTAEGSYSAADRSFQPRSALPVYERQYFPETVQGEAEPDWGTTVYENDGVRLWHLEDDIAILSFKSKQHAVGHEVLAGVLDAVEIAEEGFRGLVVWQPSEPFSYGANLKQVTDALQAKDFDALAEMIGRFQQATGRMRNSSIPVVAALRGMALGGGCEFVLHCDHTVAALESYVGLVEAGVGLIPAGGGCKEMARRASHQAPDKDVFPFIRNYFENIAMAKVAKSALEARELGFLRDCDTIVLHPHEILHVAIQQARAMAEAGYRPPLAQPVRVAGKTGIANIKAQLANMREGGFISAYDYEVAARAADALCGGEIEAGTEVSEEWLLHREWESFRWLLGQEKTADRIVHTLKTGKPLRN